MLHFNYNLIANKKNTIKNGSIIVDKGVITLPSQVFVAVQVLELYLLHFSFWELVLPLYR